MTQTLLPNDGGEGGIEELQSLKQVGLPLGEADVSALMHQMLGNYHGQPVQLRCGAMLSGGSGEACGCACGEGEWRLCFRQRRVVYGGSCGALWVKDVVRVREYVSGLGARLRARARKHSTRTHARKYP